jgi:ADP-ribosyl-[dinitrogen reductase] hydrolase
VVAVQLNSICRTRRQEAIAGALLGMAVGDSLGLPREGLSARRARRMFGSQEIQHRFLFGRGMISDDTEHALMTAQSLLASGGDATRFGRSLAWRLRFWLLGMPAGVGLGTLRAILKLWIGFPPTSSGVHSAGNGPAMRAPIIGAVFAGDPDSMRSILTVSTRITHSDPRAQQGALAIAIAAGLAASQEHREFSHDDPPRLDLLRCIREQITDQELLGRLDKVASHLEALSTPAQLANALGLSNGVSGYIHSTVPVAIFCWLRYLGDFRQSVVTAIRLGGDTDTVAGIVGALAGATTGPAQIPQDWIDGLFEWPRSVQWMERLADRVARRFPADDAPEYPLTQSLFWPGQLIRNIFFMVVVLVHGFRRLLPPY